MTLTQSLVVEVAGWDKFSYDYDRQVFSLTSFLRRREQRVQDTIGSQCFHSRESILSEMGEAGFADIHLEPAELTDRAEITELERLYGVDTSNSPIFEHLVFARKAVDSGSL